MFISMKRCQQKELIDLGPDFYTQTEYHDCLKKLFWVSKVFGFFRSTKMVLKHFPTATSLIDIGCGGGLFLLNLHRFFPSIKMRGIDINPEAIAYAKLNQKRYAANKSINFVLQNKPQINFSPGEFDIILATLVCHHLSDEELVCFFRDATSVAGQAVIINDLHRHPLAYGFYALLSPLLFRNRLITHDGLISIKRSFKRSELHVLLLKAGIRNFQIKWCWPFRWQIIIVS